MQINSNYPWVIANGKLVTIEEALTIKLEAPLIYEVIRLIDGKPLFYKAHMERLTESAALLGRSVDQLAEKIHTSVSELIKKNGIQADNLKLVIGSLEQTEPSWLIFGVKGFYPPQSWFSEGVKATLLNVSRHNPHAKVINQHLADHVDQLRATTDLFEALLVDEQGRITEGSRSNVFFIKEGRLYTPKTELALKGITRLKLMQVLEQMEIGCEEVDIEASALSDYEGVFITGTSVDLLPISSVDSLQFNTAQLPLMQSLLQGYRQVMKDSLESF